MNNNFKSVFLTLFITSSVFIACNNGRPADTEREINLMQDSASFDNSAATDTAAVNEEMADEPKKEAGAQMSTAPKKTTTPSKTGTTTTSGSVGSQNTTEPVQTVTTEPEAVIPAPTPVETATPETEAKKKGISKTAEGAIIGGAAGAVGGAIISKKKGVGAAIGAAAGAAAGAIIGKQQDKKAKQQEAAKKDTTEKK